MQNKCISKCPSWLIEMHVISTRSFRVCVSDSGLNLVIRHCPWKTDCYQFPSIKNPSTPPQLPERPSRSRGFTKHPPSWSPLPTSRIMSLMWRKASAAVWHPQMFDPPTPPYKVSKREIWKYHPPLAWEDAWTEWTQASETGKMIPGCWGISFETMDF